MPRRTVEIVPKYTNSLGITSIVLGAVSLPFLCMPCIGYIGVGIGCVGMTLGVIGLIQSMSRGGHGIGYPIGGVTLNFLSAAIGVVILVFFAGALGLPFFAKKAVDSTAPVVIDGAGGQVGDPNRVPTVGDAAELKDVRITLLSVTRERVLYRPRFADRQLRSDDEMTVVRLKVENRSDARIVKYLPWQMDRLFGDPLATLADEHGNSYVDLGWADRRVEGASGLEEIYPGKSITDVVVFKRPVEAARKLTLSLAGSQVGLSGVNFRFEFRPDQFSNHKAAEAKKDPEPEPKAGPPAKAEPKKASPPPPKKEELVDGRTEAHRKALYARLAGGLDRAEATVRTKFGGKPPAVGEPGYRDYQRQVEAEQEKVYKELLADADLYFDQAQRLLKEGQDKGWPKK